MKNKLTYGTAHFASLARAAVYYEAYGESLADVERKVKEGIISIGEPEAKPGVYYTLDAKEGRYFAHEVITRAEYMAPSKFEIGTPEYKAERAAIHHAYFIQFATNETRRIVSRHIGEARIVNSRDPHFNDIPLAEWDRINDLVFHSINRKAKIAANEYPNSFGKLFWSVSDGTCVAKSCAREIRGKQKRGKLKAATPVTFAGQSIVLPEGTAVKLIPAASGTQGDLWAVENVETLVSLTGNRHDSEHRYCFVPAESVYLD